MPSPSSSPTPNPNPNFPTPPIPPLSLFPKQPNKSKRINAPFSTMTPPPSTPNTCFGDNCDSINPWPLHQIRHHRHNTFLRLCTSCVLKHHPNSFCSTCFDLLNNSPLPTIHCSNCPSLAHLHCLSSAPPFLCPACDSPSPSSFSYFPFSRSSPDRTLDVRSAKILLTAARIAAGSMNRAAAVARGEAEKKVKEAGVASKRAREMLEMTLMMVSEQEKKNKMMVVVAAGGEEPMRIEKGKKMKEVELDYLHSGNGE